MLESLGNGTLGLIFLCRSQKGDFVIDMCV